MQIVQKISQILTEYSLVQEDVHPSQVPLFKNIETHAALDKKLSFILPAFPAKSPSRHKTSGDLPDYGEVLALKNLQSLCDRIQKIYSPGAEVVICSDGRVFSDVVFVSDQVIDQYNDGIWNIIKDYNLSGLRVFAMDDLYPNLSPDELRSFLLDVHASDLDKVKVRVQSDAAFKGLFNGIHRFLCEDILALEPTLSRSAAQKKTKDRTYELLRRSEAWSNLLSAHFPNALRLSIHPHALGQEKFGIKLVPSSNKWATPWHNVVVKIQDSFQLMHQKEALKLNAILKMERDKYAYFEVPAI